jgi:hypothetical protein
MFVEFFYFDLKLYNLNSFSIKILLKEYIFDKGSHTGDGGERFENIDDLYESVRGLIKCHYDDLHFDEDVIKELCKDEDGLIDYWLYNSKYHYDDKEINFTTEIIKLLDIYGIIVCKSDLKNCKDLNGDPYYFVMLNPYFMKMKKPFKLKKLF